MEKVIFVEKTLKGQTKQNKPYYKVKDNKGREGTIFIDVPLNQEIDIDRVDFNAKYEASGGYTFVVPKEQPKKEVPANFSLPQPQTLSNKQAALIASNIGAAHVDNKLMSSDNVLVIAQKYLDWLDK